MCVEGANKYRDFEDPGYLDKDFWEQKCNLRVIPA